MHEGGLHQVHTDLFTSLPAGLLWRKLSCKEALREVVQNAKIYYNFSSKLGQILISPGQIAEILSESF